MSFLLRRSKQKVGKNLVGPSNGQGSSLSASVAGRSRAMSRPAARAGQGQGQVLLQRQRPTSTKPSSVQRQVGQKQATNKQEQSQNGMAEVMADIRALEDQQKESQRKLENARQTREHRLQHRLSLEKSLETCKYSNAEQRVQLGRARELLASTNRLISSRRLQEDRSSEDLRAFNELIKNGLSAVRINNEYRRKADATLLFSIGKANALSKQLEEVLKQPKKLEKLRDEAKSKLEDLRQQVHAEVAKSRQNSEQVSETRSELSTLEHELSKAQQMEASTKMHAESLDNELSTEGKQYTEELDMMRRQIEANKQAKKDSETLAVEAQSAIDNVKEQLRNLQAQMASIRKAEDVDSHKTAAVNDNDKVDLDLSFVSTSLKKEEERLSASTNEKQQLLDSIASAKESEVQLGEREKMLQGQTEKIAKNANALRATETERRQAMDEKLQELETASNELSRLHQSFSELNETRANHRNMAGEKAKAQKEQIENKRQELASLALQLSDKVASIKTFRESMTQTKQSNGAKIRELNQRYNEAQKCLDETKTTLAASEAVEEEHKALEKDEGIELEDTKKVNYAISTLLHDYADYEELQGLEFAYDPSLSTDAQAESILQGLVRSCEKRVESAKKEKEAAKRDRRKAKKQQRKEEARRRRKEIAERERKEVEARKLQEEEERKRKEEAERKIQEAAAERKRQEEAERRAREHEERKSKEAERERIHKDDEERKAREQERRKVQEATDVRVDGSKEAKQYKSRELENPVEKVAEKMAEQECKDNNESTPKTDRGHSFGWDNNYREKSAKNVGNESDHDSDDEIPTDKETFFSPPVTTTGTGFKPTAYSQSMESSQKRVRWEDGSDEELIESPAKVANSPKKRDNPNRRQFGTKRRESLLEASSSNKRSATSSSKSSNLGKSGRVSKTSDMATSRKGRRNSEGSDGGGILALETSNPRGRLSSGSRTGTDLYGTGKKRPSSKDSKNSRKGTLVSPKSKDSAIAPSSSASGKENKKLSRNTSGGAKTSRSPHEASSKAREPKRKALDEQKTNSSSKKAKNQHKPPSSSKSKNVPAKGVKPTKHKATVDASKTKRKKARKNDIMGVKKTKQAASFGEDYDFSF